MAMLAKQIKKQRFIKNKFLKAYIKPLNSRLKKNV